MHITELTHLINLIIKSLTQRIKSIFLDINKTGSLVLEVSQDISPLKELDIIMTLAYKNTKNEAKQTRAYKPDLPYVAGVPLFNLKLNASSNTIKIGGRATFFVTIVLVKMVSPIKIEVDEVC